MAHNILGNRFYNNRTEPAWHGLGMNVENGEWNAEEALRALGVFDVVKKPLSYVNNEGMPEETEFFGLFREPIAEDFNWRMLGTPVTKDYELITPLTAAQLWDQNVRDENDNTVAVETVGILGRGERLFITTRLPGFDVKGDEVASYLFFDNPLENNVNVGAYVTPVRVVCQNTVMAGIAAARQTFQVTHHKGVIELMSTWLSTVYQKALIANGKIAKASNHMASIPVNDVQIKWIVEGTYPMPKMQEHQPRARQSLEERQKQWEYNIELTQRSRDTAIAFFQGSGTGMNTRAADGTAWGAFNAVSELETYRRGSQSSAVANFFTGDRGDRMRRAFNLALNVHLADTHKPEEALRFLKYEDKQLQEA
jgi:hypothetical protein